MTTAVNVNRPKSFLDAAQREKLREREARESGLMFSRDRLIEMIPVRLQYTSTYHVAHAWNLGVRGRHNCKVLATPYHMC